MAVAITEVGPAAIYKNTEPVGYDSVFEAHTGVGAGPLLAIDVESTAKIDVGREAGAIEWRAEDEAAAEVVNHGPVEFLAGVGSLGRFRRAEPRGVETQTDIAA